MADTQTQETPAQIGDGGPLTVDELVNYFRGGDQNPELVIALANYANAKIREMNGHLTNVLKNKMKYIETCEGQIADLEMEIAPYREAKAAEAAAELAASQNDDDPPTEVAVPFQG